MKNILSGLVLASCLTAVAQTTPLYENNFEKEEVGKLPDGFLSLNGEFMVKQDGTNKFLELPGTPLDTFAVLFGPTESADVAVSAHILGTAKGRRLPVFGVGLGGVSGYRLQVSPGKKALEIYKDQDLKTGIAYEWKSGEWTAMRLQVRKIADGAWKIEGKAWTAGTTEPSVWQVEFDATEATPAGRASVSGSPFSGTPIWFDALLVERVVK